MKTALLVIDVQKGVFNKSSKIWQAEELIENVNRLITWARENSFPVVFVQHGNNSFLKKGTDGWQLHPGLKVQNDDIFIDKEHGDAFKQTMLDRNLHDRGIERTVICGLVSHGCVRSACLGAHEHGYQVVLVSDVHSSFSKKAADLIIEVNQELAEQGIAEVTELDMIIQKRKSVS